MTLTKILKTSAMIAGLTLSLAACSNTEGTQTYAPEQVVENALQDMKDLNSYYLEMTMTMPVDGEATEMHFKQWQEGKKRRIEVSSNEGNATTVMNADGLTTYDETNHKVMKMALEQGDIDALSNSPSDMAQNTLNMVKDTHQLALVGEEKIIGRDTYHLKATPNADAKGHLFKDIDVWIDKENWLVLKSVIMDSNDNNTISEATKLDVNYAMTDDLFNLAIPKDAEVVDINTESMKEKSLTLDEAQQLLNVDFLYVDNNAKYQISEVTGIDSEAHKEINIQYTNNEQPFITLAILNKTTDEDISLSQDDEVVSVHGNKGTLTQFGDFMVVTWDDGAVRYSVIRDDNDVSKEELLQFAEMMYEK